MLEIEQLILRIPNISPEEGHQISHRIVQRLADRLPSQQQNRYIENLDLQISLPDKPGSDQLADRISDAIFNRITSESKITSAPSVNPTRIHRKEHRTKSNLFTPNDGRY